MSMAPKRHDTSLIQTSLLGLAMAVFHDPLPTKSPDIGQCERCGHPAWGPECDFCRTGISRRPVRNGPGVRNWRAKQKIKKKGRS